MTYCKDIREILGSVMGCNWYINFTFKFSKKIHCEKDPIWTKIVLRYISRSDLHFLKTNYHHSA